MAKGTWHIVGPGDDLMFLAEWYYGDSAAWSHIYWANLDVYGDDFEKVPAGARVFIPDVEEGANDVFLQKFVKQYALTALTRRRRAFSIWRYPVRIGAAGAAFEIATDDAGFKHVVYRFGDDTEIMTGPGGAAFAAAADGVAEEAVSGGYGSGKPGTSRVGVAVAARRRHPAEVPTVNLLRIAVEAYYGHGYMYYDVLAYNRIRAGFAGGASETTAWEVDNRVSFPPRVKRARLNEAAKWRDRVGRR